MLPPERPPEPTEHSGEHSGWRRSRVAPSLQDVYRTVPVDGGSFFRKLLAFAGPGISRRRRLHGSRATGPPTSPADRSSATRCSASSCCRTSWRCCCRDSRPSSASSPGAISRRPAAITIRAARRDRALAALRDRHRRVRSRRGDRVGDRAQSAVPHSDRRSACSSPASTCCCFSRCRIAACACSRRSSSR